MKKLIRAITLVLACALLLCGCGSAGDKTATNLKFSEAVSIDKLKALDGRQVTIVGYMATLSPVSGKYIYLMNLPYQSCPFCVPNTTQLANTMAVYAKEGKTFEYTDQAVRVTGRMHIGDNTDDFGYQYGYRIEDAVCEAIDLGEISEEYALWQSIASDGIVADINAMFDYLYLVCCWPDCQMGYVDENGEQQMFYLYSGDTQNLLEDDGPNGYKKFTAEDYFPGLTKRVEAISRTGLTELTDIITASEKLAAEALGELNGEHYTYSKQTDRYTLDKGAELADGFNALYDRFSQWLSGWEI